MLLEKGLINRFASAKPVFDSVPEMDAVLAQFPAQVHFLAIQQRGKVKQADVQVFHKAAVFLNAFDGRIQLLCGGIPAALPIEETGPIHHDTALHGNPVLKFLDLGISFLVFGLQCNRVAYRRLDLRQQLFGLPEGEISRHASRRPRLARPATGCAARQTLRR